jgi:hypothetical protein
MKKEGGERKGWMGNWNDSSSRFLPETGHVLSQPNICRHHNRTHRNEQNPNQNQNQFLTQIQKISK